MVTGMSIELRRRKSLKKAWHSFVDVQAIRELKQGIKYVTKYLTKTKHESQIQNLTLALCWLFRKRIFAVSGDFLESLKTQIKLNANRLIQVDLQGEEIIPIVEWICIGIFSANRLKIDYNEWWKIITDKIVLEDILTCTDIDHSKS